MISKFRVLTCLGCVIAGQMLTLDKLATAVEESGDLQAEPRALSRAFRNAAKEATPSVVTILSFGQNSDGEINEKNGGDAGPNSGNEELIPDGDDSNPSEGVVPDTGEPMPSPLRSDDGTSLPITGLGSGFIITNDGRIVTNNHVIAGAKRVVVQLPDQTELEAFDIYGDVESDVATLRIKPTEPIMAATLGDSDSLEIGDWVLAIGSPFKLEATVSAGIISAKHRAIARISRGRLLQTDAAINPGNSGGPLIDLDGDVVAINTAIATRNGSYQGIGFAIPINQAKWIADELYEHHRVRRAAIGIRLAELNRKVATKLNLPIGIGVVVYQVIEGSAAAKAGMKPLDVITDFADEKVRRANDLQEIVERLHIGSTQTVKVLRAGETVELQVQLAPIEDPTDVSTDAPADAPAATGAALNTDSPSATVPVANEDSPVDTTVTE
jgi:serine protease Do